MDTLQLHYNKRRSIEKIITIINNKILGKAHIRRRFFVAVGKIRSPTPIKIGTGSGRKGMIDPTRIPSRLRFYIRTNLNQYFKNQTNKLV